MVDEAKRKEELDAYAARLKLAMGLVSITELAKGLKISYQGAKKVYDAKSIFTAKNNSMAAAFLKVNPDWLATGEGLPRASDDESATLADLRDIRRINPDTYTKIIKAISESAGGARSTDQFFRENHSVKGYTSPARAAETLGKAALPADAPKPPEDSGFAGLPEAGAPPTLTSRKAKR